jgi:hypothetical protein
VTVADSAAELVAALEAAGLRVAVRDGDITPPVVYIRIGTGSSIGGSLAVPATTVFYVYYIPVRGVDNLTGDAAALDTVMEALTSITWAEVTFTASSVTVKNETWPCYRLDVALAATAATSRGT